MGLEYIHEENGDRLLIENFAGPATWAKRPVQTGHPCELREPVRGAKGSLAIQTGAERGEFVVKQRVLDPVQPCFPVLHGVSTSQTLATSLPPC